MQIFDIVNEGLFRPLTGCNKREYVDVLSLLWDTCKRMPMYGIEKSTAIDQIESYFIGLGKIEALDNMEEIDNEEISNYDDARTLATTFIRRLKKTGWLDEKEGNYEEESSIAINYKIVPIINAFVEVVNPKLVTYKGKLFKIFTLLNSVGQQSSPYETALKEVSDDMSELNFSLRQLAASIEEYIDQLTKGKTPEEILGLFGKYEEKIVVGAYHRFKTNDNLFYYRTGLYEQLDLCETDYLKKLINDCMEVENIGIGDATILIKTLVGKVKENVQEMENIMRVIDDKHILYRTRAVQRAQFMLLTDGSIKSKINGLLQYYAAQVTVKEEIFDIDDTVANSMYQIYGQNFYSYESLYKPSKRKKATDIEVMEIVDELDIEVIEEAQRKLLEYARSALTSENVNSFAKELLNDKKVVAAGNLVKNNNENIVKLIGIYTYSQSQERIFDIVMKGTYVIHNGIKFKDFIIEERK